MNFTETTAVITGAGSGIGAATARVLAAHGMNVVLAGRHRDPLQKTLDSLPSGSRALVEPTDIADQDQVRNLMDSAVEHFGSIDLLVNNAGYGLFKPITELTVDEFSRILQVNLLGTFLCTKAVLPGMYKREQGTIITISSVAGRHGFPGGGAYCAGKFGVMGLMECVFQEARSKNVRVITLTPGSVDTPFFDQAHMTPPNRDRILKPEDVADTILYAYSLPKRAVVRELDIRPTNPR